eukprot:CCRYP_001531-RA/>CCRYP_001531-RA protein AED:0.37 eAED:-0.77 QI:0/0/0/0.5/1/1/2/0/698
MVRLKLRSPFRSDEPNETQGTRRSQRIQQQRQRQQQQEREQLEASINDGETSQDRVIPGQRRSFDDIDSSNNAPLGSSQVFRRIFSGTSNKKSRRSNSACVGNINNSSIAVTGGGVSASIRRATTMFRPSSSSGRRESETFCLSTMTSFETVEVMDTTDENAPSLTGSVKHATMHSSEMKSVLEWMLTDAPPDVLPKILSFCGSRKVNALSKVNKTWYNNIVKNELVWRVMCEDTHKWKDEDEVPRSWLQHYKDNPCLPFDYDSIDAAFEAISSGPRRKMTENGVRQYFREQRKSARILLQPGPYFLRRALVCNVIGAAQVTIECLLGNDPRHGILWSRNYHKSDGLVSQQDLAHNTITARTSSILYVKRPSSATLRQAFGRRFTSQSSSYVSGQFSDDDSDEGSMSELVNGIRNGDYPLSCVEGANPTAFLIFESRRENEPCVRVRKGAVTLRGLKFLHYAEGNDIWNGNAAIQVQAPVDGNGRPLRIVPPSIVPTVNVIDCDITSMSGRGVVSIDGGISRVENCNIHNSAATGLYLGGTGSVATITHTDIFENGNGNHRLARGGVASGHSGIYVEQGVAKICDCNISKNSLTGVSAVSQENATLQIENSDLKSNGSVQVELPPLGSPSRGRSFSRGNNISVTGQGRPRTRFLQEMTKGGNGTDGPIGGIYAPLPQSPSEFPHDNVTRVAIRAGHYH